MLYREAGQFYTSSAQDSQHLPLRQDRIGMAVLLVVAFGVIHFVASDYWLIGNILPWLVPSLVALGQNIPMGYAGPLLSVLAGILAAGALGRYNLILRTD